MDKIILKNMIFFGYHGVLEEENRLGQRFVVNIELITDLRRAGRCDNFEYAINYGDVYKIVKEIMENERYKLLEALAEAIAEDILSKYIDVHEIVLEVRKPEAPVNGIFDYFAVEIRRKRNE